MKEKSIFEIVITPLPILLSTVLWASIRSFNGDKYGVMFASVGRLKKQEN